MHLFICESDSCRSNSSSAVDTILYVTLWLSFELSSPVCAENENIIYIIKSIGINEKGFNKKSIVLFKISYLQTCYIISK